MATQTPSPASTSSLVEPGPAFVEIAELGIVVLAVAQGVLLAGWLGLRPLEALRWGGFPAQAPVLFVRWAGLLHAILAAGYVLEWRRQHHVLLLIVAKGLTAAALAISLATDGLPALLILAIFIEGGLATAAWALHRPADRSRRSRARLRVVGGLRPAVRPRARG